MLTLEIILTVALLFCGYVILPFVALYAAVVVIKAAWNSL